MGYAAIFSASPPQKQAEHLNQPKFPVVGDFDAAAGCLGGMGFPLWQKAAV
jgi:hypothetical protein